MPQKSEQPRVGGITDITDMARALNILESRGIKVDLGQFQLAIDTIQKGASDPQPKAMANNPKAIPPKGPKATSDSPKATKPKAPKATTYDPVEDDNIYEDYKSEPIIRVYTDKTTGRKMITLTQELGPKVLSKSGKSYVYKVQRIPQVEMADGSRLTVNPIVAYNTIPKKLRS